MLVSEVMSSAQANLKLKVSEGLLVRVCDLVPGDVPLVITLCTADVDEAKQFQAEHADVEVSVWPPVTSVLRRAHGRWEVKIGSFVCLKPDWFVLLAQRPVTTSKVNVSITCQPVKFHLEDLQASAAHPYDLCEQRFEAARKMLEERERLYHSLTPEQQAAWDADQERMRNFYGM